MICNPSYKKVRPIKTWGFLILLSPINVKNIKSNKILKEKHGVILGNVYFCICKNLGNV